jgi:hypothetical protein
MSSLTDLRTTLDRHAEQVTDQDAVIRTTAVRNRVAVVRRRRRAFGAGALTAALVAVVAVVLVSRPHHGAEPAAPVLLGVQAPETMTSLSYTYRTDGWGRTVTGDDSVRIPASDGPRLISWTVQGSPSVRFVLPDGEIWSSRASRFKDFVALPAGYSGPLEVSAGGGSVGVATYDLTDQAPPGYTKDGITFRRTVADNPLLGAVIGDLGQTDASTTFVAPRGEVALAVRCQGLPSGDVLHVSFNGSERTSGACDDSSSFDPGFSPGYRFSTKTPGQTVSLRAWVTSGYSSQTPVAAGSVPDLRMEVGAYGPVETRRVGGSPVPVFIEQDGHLWGIGPSGGARHGSDFPVMNYRATGFEGPAEVAWNTKGRTEISARADGMPVVRGTFSGGEGSMGVPWVPRGAAVHVRLITGSGSIAMVFYRRHD